MFAALTDHGHELMLVLRSFLAPLAKWVAPKAKLAPFEGDPYRAGFEKDVPASLAPVIERIEEFEPDRIVVAPHQRTLVDEHIIKSFPAVESIALSGYLYPGDINLGLNATSDVQFTQTVAVSVDDAEVRKNELLCSAVLGEALKLPPPVLEPDDGVREQARRRVHELGLECGTYWIACVGHNSFTDVRNWATDQWAAFLRALLESHRLPLMFVGTPDEHETTEEVRRKIGSASSRTVNLCSQPADLPLFAGLISESAGYIGKDTGPMHLAAAMDKPVIAIFGGGTWPRFVPAARVGFALTVAMPCSGCHWVCHLRESHCIKLVPPGVAVAEAREVLEQKSPFHIRTITPGLGLLSRLNSEAADLFRSRTREHNGRLHQLELRSQKLGQRVAQCEASPRPDATEIHGQLSGTRHMEELLDDRDRKIRYLQIELRGQQDEMRNLRKELLSRENGLDGEIHRAATNDTLDRPNREVGVLLGQIKELTRVGGQLEKSLLDSQFDLVTVRAEREELRKQLARFQGLLRDWRHEYELLEVRHTACREKVDDLEHLRDQLQKLIDSIRRSLFSKMLVKAGIWRPF